MQGGVYGGTAVVIVFSSRFQLVQVIQSWIHKCCQVFSMFQITHFHWLNWKMWQHCTAMHCSGQRFCLIAKWQMKALEEGCSQAPLPHPWNWQLYFLPKVKLHKKYNFVGNCNRLSISVWLLSSSWELIIKFVNYYMKCRVWSRIQICKKLAAVHMSLNWRMRMTAINYSFCVPSSKSVGVKLYW